MSSWQILILAILIGGWALGRLVQWLNLRHAHSQLPPEAHGLLEADKYHKAQDYLRANTRLAALQASVDTAFWLLLLLFGGFDALDRLARELAAGEITRGYWFLGLLLLAKSLLDLPFTLYDTFFLEARFGFNKTTPATFVLDRLKMLGLGVALGAPLLALIIWFLQSTGEHAWLWAWLMLTGVQMVLLFVAPVWLMPLFNKFTPLPAGELRDRIEAYAREQKFSLSGIFTMDGSKRSNKVNAYFTGFGRFRRVVLYDTLINTLNTDELLAVLAHEVGHYRRRHLPQQLVVGLLSSALLFYLLNGIIGHEAIFAAFGMTQPPSIYASLVFVGILFEPIAMLIDLVRNGLSRRHEYQADAFAAATTGGPGDLASALRKLAAGNLVNLTPHPLKVALEDSHPPILARLSALNSL